MNFPILCVLFTILRFSGAQEDQFAQCEAKCIFNDGTITSGNIGTFPKCAKVCSFLVIDETSGVTEKQLTTAFKNMKTLIGSLEIRNTNYKSASFLAGLQKVESAMAGIRIKENGEMLQLGWKNMTTTLVYYFEVVGNSKLQKLNLPKWKTFSCPVASCTTVGIMNTLTTPNFCFSAEELKVLSNQGVFCAVIAGKVCAPKASNKKQCKKPTVGCQELVGNLNIGPKFDVKKVKALKFLFGGLIVKGTNLTNLNALGNLTRIVQMNVLKPSIDIQNNKQLKTIKMPKLERIMSGHWDNPIIKNNNKALLTDVDSCLKIREVMQQGGEDKPVFGTLTCEQMGGSG